MLSLIRGQASNYVGKHASHNTQLKANQRFVPPIPARPPTRLAARSSNNSGRTGGRTRAVSSPIRSSYSTQSHRFSHELHKFGQHVASVGAMVSSRLRNVLLDFFVPSLTEPTHLETGMTISVHLVASRRKIWRPLDCLFGLRIC